MAIISNSIRPTLETLPENLGVAVKRAYRILGNFREDMGDAFDGFLGLLEKNIQHIHDPDFSIKRIDRLQFVIVWTRNSIKITFESRLRSVWNNLLSAISKEVDFPANLKAKAELETRAGPLFKNFIDEVFKVCLVIHNRLEEIADTYASSKSEEDRLLLKSALEELKKDVKIMKSDLQDRFTQSINHIWDAFAKDLSGSAAFLDDSTQVNSKVSSVRKTWQAIDFLLPGIGGVMTLGGCCGILYARKCYDPQKKAINQSREFYTKALLSSASIITGIFITARSV